LQGKALARRSIVNSVAGLVDPAQELGGSFHEGQRDDRSVTDRRYHPETAVPSLALIRDALAAHPASSEPPQPSSAAVAMVLAGPPEALDLCFILRATREGDRWSGQMAFPGGRAEPSDLTAQAAAIRETHEEVGLRLHHAEALGSLPSTPLRPAGSAGELHPFAFYVGDARPPLHPNEAEVAEAYWIPLTHLWDADRRGTIDWPWKGETLRFPGIRARGQLIWGLTYRVLHQWAQRLGKPLPGSDSEPYERVG